MERVPLDLQGLHLSGGDLDAGGIRGAVQGALDGETGAGGCARNQVEDDGVAEQRPGPPVLANEREEPMLDLVPLAGPRREVADRERQTAGVGPLLQLPLPQPIT